MEHANHVRLTEAELIPDLIEGTQVYSLADDKVGSVSHVLGSGPTSEIVIDVGGFLGIGSKPVALQANQLEFMRDEDGEVHAVTAFTQEQLKSMPEYRDGDELLPWPPA